MVSSRVPKLNALGFYLLTWITQIMQGSEILTLVLPRKCVVNHPHVIWLCLLVRVHDKGFVSRTEMILCSNNECFKPEPQRNVNQSI